MSERKVTMINNCFPVNSFNQEFNEEPIATEKFITVPKRELNNIKADITLPDELEVKKRKD
ncbi:MULTISPECIES: hypothetical protein [Vagococcus]|uniref:Uncharacterized protein n=1 Tax=Vagococcus fluvialis bH819 TaxID=1255619 RepID=A0A1X6WP12_9ENTE|nr:MULTISPECIES: hypothetical protein [Vagococcus]SLM86025.1 hypothetical protein FM121_08055 [Vagococcus fluvialis bH819]HCM88844.1 hypothetical protein [Vagococcus sp.]